MADKRIRDLAPATSLDTTYKVAVDKSGLTEAEAATVSQLNALLSGIRAGKQALTMDVETTISFTTAFSSTDYALLVNAYDGSGNPVSVKVSSITSSSFKATAAANCTIHYLAHETT